MRVIPSVISFALLCAATTAQAQELKPENIVSPEAASLGKFGNVPIGFYTGSPDISIPLYTLKVGDMEVPVVLRYHASGIQVEQEATWVGLGWDLSVGGSITQVVSGLPDQHVNLTSPGGSTFQEMMRRGTVNDGYQGMDNTIYSARFCVDAGDPLMNDMGTISTLKAYDWGKPDIFKINAPGISEDFMLTPVGQTPVHIGKKKTPVFITKHLFAQGSNYGMEWTVEDVSGNKFFFADGDHEYSYAEASQPLSGAVCRLSRITTATGRTVDFSYVNGKYLLRSYSASKSFGDWDPPPPATNDVSNTTYYAKYMTGMESEHIRVAFELSATAAERDDLDGQVIDGNYGARRLNAIHVWDKRTNRKLKSFVFTYSYFLGDANSSGRMLPFPPAAYLTKRLKLLSVQEVGYTAAGAPVLEVPPYTFEYNETMLLPRKDGYSRDHWGLYNAQANSSFIPKLYSEIVSEVLTIPGVTSADNVILDNIRNAGTANKGMEPGPATVAILQKLTYPTKGYTVFNYEPHTYKNYRTYSADEIRRSVGVISTTVDDKNYNTNVIKSAPIYPDATGNVRLRQFNCSFSSVGTKIDHTYFLGCYVKLWRVSAGGTRTQLRQWVVTAPRDIFNQTGSQAYPAEDILLSGDTADYYEVESHLDNIPQLTPVGTSIPKAVAHANWGIIDKQMVEKESIGGGLRIASIENYAGENQLAGKKIFKYLKADGITSSGKLMAPPRYLMHARRTHHVRTVIDGIYYYTAYPAHSYSVASFSYVPLSADAEGSYVGYDRIEVADVDENGAANGKTVYQYKNTQSTTSFSGFHNYGKSLPTVGYYSNGQLETMEVYASDGTLLKKQDYTYKLLERTTTRGLMLGDLYCDDFINNAACVGFGQPPLPERWVGYFYPINTKWYVPETVTETTFSTVPMSITTTNTYNAYGQLIKEEKTGSKGDAISKNTTYPLDVASPDAVVTAMKTRKLYDRPLEQLQQNGSSQRLTTFQYAINEHNHIQVTRSALSLNGQPPFDLVRNVRHDEKGNIVQYEENGVMNTFVYGYQQSLPVLKVVGADYATVVAGLNTAAILQQPVNDAQLATEIANVRNRFASGKVMVTGYIHSPLLGITREIDPAGKQTFYEYDAQGRLQHIRDQDGKILKVFQYQFQQ